MVNKIKTGKIIPRNYGLAIRTRDNDRIFVSPMKYALGAMILESEAEIAKRFERFSENFGMNFSQVKREFVESLKKRGISQDFLRKSSRGSVLNVKKYSNIFSAEIISSSLGENYHVQLANPCIGPEGNLDYMHSRCDCQDSFWTDVKKRSAVCKHIGALEIALYKDSKSRQSVDENVTGLKPSQRMDTASMPFTFFDGRANTSDLIAQMLFDYFVEGRRIYDIDRGVLENPAVYSSSLSGMLQKSDLVDFVVLREREEERSFGSESEKRIAAARKALEKRLCSMVHDKGYEFDGYGLEFKGTEFETISRRYKKDNSLYSICSGAEYSPIVVKKILGDKVDDVFAEHEIIDMHPMQSTFIYQSVDDSTRREALTKVIIPGKSEKSKVFVPKILENSYTI